MLVPILLHYFWLCCVHDCNVDAHANNIPTLFITAVLCPILCKRKLLTQQLTVKFLLHPKLGGTLGVSVCTLVLYVHWLCLYNCLVVSQRPDQCTQAAQYKRRPTNQGPASESSDQSDCLKNETLTHSLTHSTHPGQARLLIKMQKCDWLNDWMTDCKSNF